MGLAELRGDVQSFQDSQEAQQRANDEEERRRREQYEASKKQELQEWPQEASKILARLDAQEILEIVKNEVWGEGQVKESTHIGEDHASSSLYLHSDSYSVVQLRKRGSYYGRVVIDTGVTSFNIRAEYYGPEKTGKVIIGERPFLSLRSESPSDIKRLVKEYGLRRGLERVGEGPLRYGFPDSFYGGEMQISGKPEEIGEFKAFVLKHIEDQIDRKGLPQDIRAYTSAVVEEMPASLKTNREVTLEELEVWAREIQNKDNVIYQSLNNLRNKIGQIRSVKASA